MDGRDKITAVEGDGAYDTANCLKPFAIKGLALRFHGVKALSNGLMMKRVLFIPGPPLSGAALKSVKLNGNGKVVTIAGVWRKPRCFGSKDYSAIN